MLGYNVIVRPSTSISEGMVMILGDIAYFGQLGCDVWYDRITETSYFIWMRARELHRHRIGEIEVNTTVGLSFLCVLILLI